MATYYWDKDYRDLRATAADKIKSVESGIGAVDKALALNKDKINARQALDKAFKLQSNFPGADDARKILDSLK